MVIVSKKRIFLHLFIPVAIVELFRPRILKINVVVDLINKTFLNSQSIIYLFIFILWIISMIVLYYHVLEKLGGDPGEY